MVRRSAHSILRSLNPSFSATSPAGAAALGRPTVVYLDLAAIPAVAAPIHQVIELARESEPRLEPAMAESCARRTDSTDWHGGRQEERVRLIPNRPGSGDLTPSVDCSGLGEHPA